MSKVIMMCGVCGSGKTSYSKQKEKEGYIRLSIDEEMWKIYGKKGIDYPDSQYEELSEKVELTLRERLLKLIKEGQNIVIDFSFWSKENRKRLTKRRTCQTQSPSEKIVPWSGCVFLRAVSKIHGHSEKIH